MPNLTLDGLSAFHCIIETANSIVNLTAGSSRLPQLSSSDSGSPRGALPIIPHPTPILQTLILDGVPSEVANKLSTLFDKVSSQLYLDFESGFHKTWSKVSAVPNSRSLLSSEALRSKLWMVHAGVYQKKVDAWAQEIRKKAASRITALQMHGSTPKLMDDAGKGRPKFKHDFLPSLEACFAKNQRPSKADKAFLASRSGMSVRQIHVWFQNRRSRTKKGETYDALRDTVEERKVGGLVESSLANDYHAVQQLPRPSSVTRAEDDAFSTRAPSYAFPMSYPPERFLEADPFPCRSGDFSLFGKPCWPRQSDSRLQKSIEPDMSALCLAFANLSIGGAAHPSLQKKNNRARKGLEVSSKESECDVTSPYTVRPLRAPLMSLVRNFASRVFHRSGKPLDDVQRSQCEVVAAPTVKSGAQSAQRKTRRRQASASRRSAVSADQNSARSAYSPNEPTSFSASNSSVATTCIWTMDQPSKVKKSTRKSSSSQRVPAASTSKRGKGGSAPIVQAPELSSEPPTVHPSPTASVDSLPSLSYSSGSSSASTCSQSPTTSFGVLPGNDLLPSLDPYLPSGSSLTLHLAPTVFEDLPSLMFPPSDISFDFSKGPLDYTSNLGLPSYPSYLDSFDSLSQGLQSSPDFPPPVLTLDSISFAV